MACHHRPWTANMVERRRVWHAITAFRQHTRSNDVGRGMPSSPLGSTHGRTTSGVECHHSPWTTHTIGNVGRGMTSPHLDSTHGLQSRAWHADITALGQHTRSPTSGVALHHRPWTAHTLSNVGRGMTSPPFDCTHDRQNRAWHDITAVGQHTRSATSGVA